MIVWLNGTHGAGKTTTSRLVQPLIPRSRVFVVETASRVLDYAGGTLVMPSSSTRRM